MNVLSNNKYSGLRRSYALDAIKIVFAISVALGHFQYGAFLSSNTVVECFFIMSGYFLMQSYQGKRYEDAYHYTKNRIKRIYPYYIIAFLGLFVYVNRTNLLKIDVMFEGIIRSIPEMLFIQNIGVFNGGINYPLWQLCVLIVVSHIWFALLSWNHNVVVDVICPIIAIMTLTYLANTYNTHTVDIFTVESKVLYVPLIRAAGFVAIGIMSWKVINKIVAHLEQCRVNCFILSLLAIISVWVFLKNQWNYIAHIAFGVIMICSISTKGIFSFILNRRIFKFGEKLSLSIYLNHALIIYILRDYFAQYIENLSSNLIVVLFIVVLTLYSVIFVNVIDGVKKLLKFGA